MKILLAICTISIILFSMQVGYKKGLSVERVAENTLGYKKGYNEGYTDGSNFSITKTCKEQIDDLMICMDLLQDSFKHSAWEYK